MSLPNIQAFQTNIPLLENYLKTLKNGTEIQVSYLPRFNEIIFGFERKKLIVVGSRPSEGKSTFCLQMAYELSLKFKVLYISLEMTREEAMFRLMCYVSRIENVGFYRQSVSSAGPLDELREGIKDRTLIVSEEIGRTWEEVENILFELRSDPPDIIFLDYIQCIQTNGKKLEAIEDYIKRFRKMAIDSNFCLFICSQINRQNISETKEPTMEGLKNTGFLEEHADKVILLYYPCKRTPNTDKDKFKIIVAKNKNGMTAFLDCKITPSIYKIYEEKEQNDNLYAPGT